MRPHRRSAARASKGSVSVFVFPWAEVFIGRRRIGVTPIREYPLTAGRHRVVLRNEELGKEETTQINVKPEQALRIRRDWLTQ